MRDDDEWENVVPPGVVAGLLSTSVGALETRPRDVELALNDGDVIGARLGAARRLNQLLKEYEDTERVKGLSRDSMEVLVKGYTAFEKMASATHKDMAPAKDTGGEKTTGDAELRKALAEVKRSPGRPRKTLAVVSGGAHVEDAEFVVDAAEVDYGPLVHWAGMKFAQLPHALTVLEMVRHGATVDMIREVYSDVTSWMVGDIRKFSEKMFGKPFEPPPLALRRRGGWYRGPHKDRYKVEAAP
jgi:hypothetical protein